MCGKCDGPPVQDVHHRSLGWLSSQESWRWCESINQSIVPHPLKQMMGWCLLHLQQLKWNLVSQAPESLTTEFMLFKYCCSHTPTEIWISFKPIWQHLNTKTPPLSWLPSLVGAGDASGGCGGAASSVFKRAAWMSKVWIEQVALCNPAAVKKMTHDWKWMSWNVLDTPLKYD